MFVLVPASTSPADVGLLTFVTTNGEPVVASAEGVVAGGLNAAKVWP